MRAVGEQLVDAGYVVIPNVLQDEEIEQRPRRARPASRTRPARPQSVRGIRHAACLLPRREVARFDRLILDPMVLEVTERALGPNFLLTATLAIDLHPGESAQDFHWDDTFYKIPRPRPPVSISTLWAIDDFTADNGATLIYPGSHNWGDKPPAELPDVVPAEMSAGSVLVYAGTLVHAGGANTSGSCRLGVSIQYCAAWARQQENFMMAIGTDGARSLAPRLQELIGYSIHPPFMGMIDGRHPIKLLE